MYFFFTLLVIIWFAISQQQSMFFVAIAIISTLFSMLVKIKITSIQTEYKVFNLIIYPLWIIKEIFISTNKIVAIIWQQKTRITPFLGEYKTDLQNDNFNTLLANSITLTPGTLSIKLENDRILYHSIFGECNSDISVIENKIKNIQND